MTNSPKSSRIPVDLRLDWIEAKSARYACEQWHYARCMPKSKNAYIGVWENGKWIGVIIYGVGASAALNKPFGIPRTRVIELCRIALKAHQSQVSRLIAITTKMIRRRYSRVRLIMSFADQAQGHHGGIYQAAGWSYIGQTGEGFAWDFGGDRLVHSRVFSGGHFNSAKRSPPPHARKVRIPPKHRYALPLDDEMRTKIEAMRKPYPKRAGSDPVDTTGVQPGEGGSTPTPALSRLSS